MPCSAFLRGSNKKQKKGRIISSFTKGETFISYANQVFLRRVILQCGPPSSTLHKKPFSPLNFGQNTWTLS